MQKSLKQKSLDAYHFREANVADLDQIKALGLLAYGAYQSKLSEENWKKMEANFTTGNTIDQLLSIAYGFVCEINTELVGMAFLVPRGNPNQIFREDWSQIRLVGVHPQHAGKGIGRALTRYCIEKAVETGEKNIALHTSDMMGAAPHLYESFGFNIHSTFEHFGKEYRIYLLNL